MDLSEIVSVSGLPGLYKIAARREDGLIVSDFDGGNKKFLAARKFMFTPLDNITIYTMEDSVELATVLQNMKKQESETPLVEPNASGADLRDYFTKIQPDHDQEKVYTSDIKKLIKWYKQLDENGMVVLEEKSKKKEKKEDKKKEPAAKEESAGSGEEE